MTDLALAFNPAIGQLDIGLSAGDLAVDNGLYTAVILSLLLDRPALPGDVLPSPNSQDRRGWWGNAYLPPLGGKADFYGSRLWLLKRAVQNNATLAAAKTYALEALNWMLVDKVVGSLSVVCSYTGIGQMNINISFGQTGCAGPYNVPWSFS